MKKNGSLEPFVMLRRSLLNSSAWRTASINCRRLLDHLMSEHLAHGGKENGKLKAPHAQLVTAGISPRLVTATIAEAEHRGLVRARRGGMRVATEFTLTWLSTADSKPPTNDWQNYQPTEPTPEQDNQPPSDAVLHRPAQLGDAGIEPSPHCIAN